MVEVLYHIKECSHLIISGGYVFFAHSCLFWGDFPQLSINLK